MDSVKRPLEVVIVGAGFAGLIAAIECRLRGMHAVLIETYPTSRTQGDVIDFFPNGGRILGSYDNGRLGKDLLKVCINKGDQFEFYRHDGVHLCDDPWILRPHHYYEQFAGHRGEIHHIVSQYAEEIGVEIRFGETVVRYLEEDSQRPAVVTQKGTTITGDVVIAADGPKSLARAQILGLPESRVNSGYAIYRAFFTMNEEHKKNPLIKEYTNPEKDYTRMWIGKDLHFIVYSWNQGRDMGWVLTHKDDHDIQESWSFPGRIEDVLAYLEEGNFIEQAKEIVRQTPPNQLIDYKLVWRDPIATWLGKSGHTVVIGDAAHCHLPTSGQGASQAVEDGAILAACLDRSPSDISLALRVFERIRFNRSHATHMLSTQTRDEYHNIEWTPEFCKNNPDALFLPRPIWIAEYDWKSDVDNHFDRLAAEILTGKTGSMEELSVPSEQVPHMDDRTTGRPNQENSTLPPKAISPLNSVHVVT